MKYLVLLAIVAGCQVKSLGNAATDNPSVQVDSLFTHNGCTVFRFTDANRFHYYAVCEHHREVSVINEYPERSGKTTWTRVEELPTLER